MYQFFSVIEQFCKIMAIIGKNEMSNAPGTPEIAEHESSERGTFSYKAIYEISLLI